MKSIVTYLRLFCVGVLSTSPASASFSLDGVAIGSDIQSLPASLYTCVRSSAAETRCVRRNSTRAFGVVPIKIEILFDENRCYLIFIGLTPNDTVTVGKKLHSVYGEPKAVTEIIKGVYSATWYQETSMLALVRDTGWQRAWISITNGDTKPLRRLQPNPATQGALRDQAV